MIFFDTAITLNVDWKIGEIKVETEKYEINSAQLIEFFEKYKSVFESSINLRVFTKSIKDVLNKEIILSIEESFNAKFKNDIEVKYLDYSIKSFENDECESDVETADKDINVGEDEDEDEDEDKVDIFYEVNYRLNYRQFSIDFKWEDSCHEDIFFNLDFKGLFSNTYPPYAFKRNYCVGYDISFEYSKYTLEAFINNCWDQYLDFNVLDIPEPTSDHPLQSLCILFVIAEYNLYYISASKDRMSYLTGYPDSLEKVFFWKYGINYYNSINGYIEFKNGKFVVDINVFSTDVDKYKGLIIKKFNLDDTTVFNFFD